MDVEEPGPDDMGSWPWVWIYLGYFLVMIVVIFFIVSTRL